MTSGAWYTAVWELPLLNLPCWAVRASQEDIHRASCRPRNPSMPSTLTQMRTQVCPQPGHKCPPRLLGPGRNLLPELYYSQSAIPSSQSCVIVSHPFQPLMFSGNHRTKNVRASDSFWHPKAIHIQSRSLLRQRQC